LDRNDKEYDMSQQVICDNCGVAIDETQPYYEVSGGQVQKQGEAPPVAVRIGPLITLHYHQDHLPVGVEPVPQETPEPGEPHHPTRPEAKPKAEATP
jgi:hypothetical protein